MTAISTRSYSDEAFLYIRQKIIDDEVPFGARLHIGKLARELGISQTPVREALNRLAMEGMAEITPHRGIFVVDPCERDVSELCEVRLCLELWMADAVVRTVTGDQIECLRTYANEAKLSLMGFHDYYAEISGNSLLHKLYSQVHGLAKILFAKVAKVAGPEALTQHRAEEREILKAIEARDVSAVRKSIRVHVRSYEKLVIQARVITDRN